MTQGAQGISRHDASPLPRPVPFGARIADQLRRDILFGTLTPDMRITQEGICKRFGTSRVPARDAIQTLTGQGFIEETTSGIRPVRLTESDLSDMFHVEGILHALATQFATERCTPEQIDKLDALNAQMKAALDSERYSDMAKANSRFHRDINLFANSPRLVVALRVVSLRIQTNYLERFPQRAASALKDHRAIVQAMRAGDAEQASAIMLKHVRASATTLHQAISSVRRGELSEVIDSDALAADTSGEETPGLLV